MAAAFVVGAACNGWLDWKTAEGKVIDSFRSQRD